MSIEIINVASSTHSGDNDSNLAGVIKLIVYKENNIEIIDTMTSHIIKGKKFIFI